MAVAIGLAVAVLALRVPARWVRPSVARWRAMTPSPSQEAHLCAAIAADLRAGATVRLAVADGLSALGDRARCVRRRLIVGAPLVSVADEIALLLPLNGRQVAMALEVAGGGGGRAADVFSRLAERAATAAALRRERRVVTAQARLSARVVGGLPLVVTVALLLTGRLSSLPASGRVGVTVLGAGLALQIGGLAVMAAMMRDGDR